MEKVWCKKCYEKIRSVLNQTYGKHQWYFDNFDDLVFFRDNEAERIISPPLLKVVVPRKLKSGKYSKSKTRKSHISQYNFCPFCGKAIKPEEVQP